MAQLSQTAIIGGLVLSNGLETFYPSSVTRAVMVVPLGASAIGSGDHVTPRKLINQSMSANAKILRKVRKCATPRNVHKLILANIS